MASQPLANWAQPAARPRRPALGPIVPREEISPAQPRLSGLHWSVVALAERDTLATLREPGRLATAFGNLFGGSSSTKLADPQLEALRRIAVYAWRRGWQVPTSEIKAFEAAGFTLDQYELIQHSVARSLERSRARGAAQ